MGLLKITPDVEVTRKSDRSIHLHGFRDDVIKHKEIINNLVIQHCEKSNKSKEELYSIYIYLYSFVI